jgi:ankyrin repeat protein
MSRLREALKTTQGRTDGLSEMTPSTEEAFARKALELYKRGHRLQALGIFERNLGGKSEQFESFIKAQASRFKGAAPEDEAMRMLAADGLVGSGEPGTDSAPHLCLSGAGGPEDSIAPLERHIAAPPVTGKPSELKQQLKEALTSRNGKEIGRLFMNVETMALLQDLFDDLFASIQGGLAWIGHRKTLRPLWFDLACNAEHGVFIFQRLIHMGLSIGDDIWRFIPKKDQGTFPEYSFLYWLLLTPEGHAILTELLTKQDISTILTSDFLMKGIPGHPSVCPLSMIFTSEPGLKLLSYLIKKYPKAFKDIPAKTWLNLHPTIQSEDGRPLSLLHIFLRTAAGEMALKLLISQNPSLKRVFLNELTSIMEAIRRDDTTTIKLYHLLGVDFNAEFSSPYTLPYIAVDFRSKAVLKLLWEYHVDFYKPSKDGGTPAIRTMMQNNTEMMGLLHALGVDFNRPGSEDIIRPVFQATIKGQEHLLGLLKEYGADLTIEIATGCTPALYAARHNYIGALNELHRLGVDLKKSNKTGLTPAVIAVEFKKAEALETILNLNPTIDVNELFFYAVRKGHIPTLRLLIHKGADCEQLQRVTPEHLMIIDKDTETSEEGRERIRECLAAAPPNILITALEYAEFCGKIYPLYRVLEEQLSKDDESRATIGDQLGQFGLLHRKAAIDDAGEKATEAPRI